MLALPLPGRVQERQRHYLGLHFQKPLVKSSEFFLQEDTKRQAH